MILLWFSLNQIVSGAENEYYKYLRTDSAHVYTWNAATSSWLPGSVQLYTYVEGKMTSVLTIDYASRALQARTDYLYNTDGLMSTETSYLFSGNIWVTLTRNLYSYDELGRYSEIHIQKWINSDWVDDRIQMNYVYDEFSRQLKFQAIYFRNNTWTDPTTENSYYNADGLLERREAVYFNGNTDYEVIYTYDGSELLAEAYSHYPSGSGWINWWLVDYDYNPCGLRLEQVRYTGNGTEWVPSARVVSFTYFKPDLCPDKKVPVCRDGSTVIVKKTVVQNRLNHGDCLGPCPEGKGSNSPAKKSAKTEQSEIPFTIYPNPATDRITVVRNGYDENISKVELTDMNGRTLRSEVVSDDGDIVIPRNGLISGQYLVRVYGDQVYSMIVIFN